MRARVKMVEKRLEDECCMRSHMDRTGPGARWLRSAEGEQLQLFESILDRISQLIRERLQPLLRTAIVEAQRPKAAEDGLHRIKPRRLVAGDASRCAAKGACDVLVVVRTQPVAEA